MTDAPSLPPSTEFDRIVAGIGNLARPFVLYAAAGSAALATVSIVWMKLDLITGAAFIGASWTGVAALYGAKAWETAAADKQAAKVEMAKTQAPPPA